LRLIRSRLFRCLDRRTRRCDVGDESHGGRLWANAWDPSILIPLNPICPGIATERQSS
jgi:hypothetical protein